MLKENLKKIGQILTSYSVTGSTKNFDLITIFFTYKRKFKTCISSLDHKICITRNVTLFCICENIRLLMNLFALIIVAENLREHQQSAKLNLRIVS